MNNFNPRSEVVLVELDETVIEQPMDETRDGVVVLDTLQGTQVPRHSGRIVGSPIRFIDLEETYEAISEEAKTNPYT